MKAGRSTGRESGENQPRVPRGLPPHVIVFGILCLLYFVPLWLVSNSSFEQGGILAVGIDAHRVMTQIVCIYVLGFVFLFLGSWSVPKLCWLLGAKSSKRLEIAPLRLYRSDGYLLAVLAGSFVLSKLLLIPLGVYSAYFFDSGAGGSPVWTASMFLSDVMALASFLALFSGHRHNLLLFLSITALNGINLLHGTRNFFVIAVLAFATYAYVRSKASITKMAIYSVAGSAGALLLAYAVFISRSHVSDAGFSPLDIVSPLTFESVFSQMSLVTLLNRPLLIPGVPQPFHLLTDVVFFTLPRFLVADKESGLWIAQYGFLSPLGAFNGFAAGLLYFGYFFPLFYYLVGVVLGLLHRWATNGYAAILYLYVTCDLLYRICRDGYYIPGKMFLNTAGILAVVAVVRTFCHHGEGLNRVPSTWISAEASM